MIDPIVKIQTLLNVGVLPIWMCSAVFALLVSVSLPRSVGLVERGATWVGVIAISVLIYASVGRPAYEGWGIATRPDLRLENGQPPVLAQTTYRLERDPRDPFAYAAVGDFLAQDLSISPEAPIAADASYREAEQFGSLTADQYANWAGVVHVSGLEGAEWYTDSFERIVGEALAIEPSHVYARLLQADRLEPSLALPVLRKIATDVSAAEPLSQTIDDRILMLVVGEHPSIAPDLAAVSEDRVNEVLAGGDENEPPFMRMVRQLEGKTLNPDGGFVQPIGDAEFDQSVFVDLYRLGRVRNVVGNREGAIEALSEALRVTPSDSGLRFWIAQEFWQAGRLQIAIDTLDQFRATMPEGSPEWRAAGLTLESLREVVQ